jgi:outer membrane protein assembly factor BamB
MTKFQSSMRVCLAIAGGVAMIGFIAFAQDVPTDAPYKVLKTAKVGGDGGFDYVTANSTDRQLYVGRSAQPHGRVMVYNLDTLEKLGEVDNADRVHGATASPKSHHGFTSSNPVVMFDTKTFATIKTIDVKGSPDGYLYDAFNDHVYILSHQKPHATIINAADGAVVGTIDDLGGAPEQAATDGKGTIYVDLEDAHAIAVVDAKAMTVKTKYDLAGKADACAGLALDAKNQILFAACRNPQVMVIVNAKDGMVITTLPLAGSSDGAAFNPKTMEAFSSHGNGTLTVVKEENPTTFKVEENLNTMSGGKTQALDDKTGHIMIIAAEYAAPPQPATPPDPSKKGGRGARGQMVPDSFTILEVGK